VSPPLANNSSTALAHLHMLTPLPNTTHLRRVMRGKRTDEPVAKLEDRMARRSALICSTTLLLGSRTHTAKKREKRISTEGSGGSRY